MRVDEPLRNKLTRAHMYVTPRRSRTIRPFSQGSLVLGIAKTLKGYEKEERGIYSTLSPSFQ